jgi:hypothetical protein
MTKKQAAFLSADIADRVRLAADVARKIATQGLASRPDDGLMEPDPDGFVIDWLSVLAGPQSEQLTDEHMNTTAAWEDLERLASMAYALGVAVGLRQSLEAYEGGQPARRSQEIGPRGGAQ